MINFTTARGANIAINNGALNINGQAHHGGIDLAIDPDHGLCVKTYFGGITIPVPVEAQDSVQAEFAAHSAAVKDAGDAEDAYDSRHNRIIDAMQGE